MALILIVDDREICREFLATILHYSHHHLLQADDGAAALKLIKQHHPDIVISDLLMPVMNGYELVQAMKSDPALSSIPIIFYTASFLTDEAKLLAQACGVDHVLFKPSDPDIIIATVNKVLGIKDVPGKVFDKKTMTEIITKIQPDFRSNIDQIKKLISKLEKSKNDFTSVIIALQRLGDEEEGLLKKAATFNSAFNEMQVIADKLIELQHLVQSLILEKQEDDLLNLSCAGASKILGCKYCVLGIFAEGYSRSDSKQNFASVYISADGKDIVKLEGYALESNLVKEIIESSVPIANNQMSEPYKADLNMLHPVENSFLGVRLQTATHLYGIMYFIDKMDDTEFNELDIQVVAILANETAALYENILAFDELQKHAAQLQIKTGKSKNDKNLLPISKIK